MQAIGYSLANKETTTLTMKANHVLFKSLTSAAAFTAVFFGFVKLATGLPLGELAIAYVATLAVIGLAAADDAKRAA